jgi:hypothetical protein
VGSNSRDGRRHFGAKAKVGGSGGAACRLPFAGPVIFKKPPNLDPIINRDPIFYIYPPNSDRN